MVNNCHFNFIKNLRSDVCLLPLTVFDYEKKYRTDLLANTIGMFTPMISSWHGKWYGGQLVCAFDGFLHFVVGMMQTNICNAAFDEKSWFFFSFCFKYYTEWHLPYRVIALSCWENLSVMIIHEVNWKTFVNILRCGHATLWEALSVRPSVRPSIVPSIRPSTSTSRKVGK